jgi:hypothetical protein
MLKFISTVKWTFLSAGFLTAAGSHAATLTAVPMQGGMVMPMLTYHTDDGRIHVMLTNTVPVLTPLLVSNPQDNFNPADPWFGALDPSARGAAFSRRYGFMWDSGMSDPLPVNTEVWIRKLAGTPGLNVYRYNGNEPKAFEPIFGTAGTTNALAWNLMMFHPCFTAAPGTNALSAAFEVYLVDASTGSEVPDSSTGPFTFNFDNLPDGRPALNLAPKITVGWPTDTTANWVLECAPTPDAVTWMPVTNAPVLLEGRPAVVLDATAGQQYFRMRYVP